MATITIIGFLLGLTGRQLRVDREVAASLPTRMAARICAATQRGRVGRREAVGSGGRSGGRVAASSSRWARHRGRGSGDGIPDSGRREPARVEVEDERRGGLPNSLLRVPQQRVADGCLEATFGLVAHSITELREDGAEFRHPQVVQLDLNSNERTGGRVEYSR